MFPLRALQLALYATMSMTASSAWAQSNCPGLCSDTPINSTTPNNGYLFGYYQYQQGANGSVGASTTSPLFITNTASITLNSNTPITGGAGIWATDQAGSANPNYDSQGSFPGGSSAGVTVNNYNSNSDPINATASGSTGFAGIQAMSIGGSGFLSGYGGNGGAAAVNSDYTVTTNWTWVNAGSSNSGVWGVMASSRGGTGASNNIDVNYNSGGAGGQAGPASVTLTEYGDVSLNVYGTAPTIASPTSAAVAAISQGGDGGYAMVGNASVGGNGGAAGLTTISTTDNRVYVTGDNLPALLAYGVGGAGGSGGSPSQTSGQLNPSQNGGSGGSTAGATINVNAVTRSAYISTVSYGNGESPAIAAIQVGGAGAYGGFSQDTALSESQGGNGGNGGTAGTITINALGQGGNSVVMSTDADVSPGIYASSLGGAGAYGGGSYTGAGGSSQAGAGGAGGAGGDININLASASITTAHSTSPGIVARSEGGIGAAGGNANAGTGTSANGGNGGAGGAAGNITITTDNHSSISTTYGSDADGIFAQSLSGVGGDANGNNSIGGGSAGNAGAGGAVGTITINNGGSIKTVGATSRGILVQSMAGIGGTGGSSWKLIHAAGGSGGSGGVSGTLIVNNSGNISTGGDPAAGLETTNGDTAQGILMQSIGGGGGAGGQASGVISDVGGGGGNATGGGTITFNNSGAISTLGIGAIGVLGQSVGGNGGDGGGASSISVAVGGAGGDSALGGTINATMTNGSSVTTTGNNAHGMVFQSIGGGGGNGGNANTTGIAASVSIGASGGNGGGGGAVTVQSTDAVISTAGTKAVGLVAQSIGGGGGTGGTASGASIGALFDASVAIGGSGGTGSSGGGTVTVGLVGGSIATGQNLRLTQRSSGPANCPGPCNVQSVDNYGVVVQSIGGGGGLGGNASAESIALAVPISPDGTQLAISSATAIGGAGGAGGDGGLANFSMSNGSTIFTLGSGATGALVQSIGGGGGAGGDSSAMAASVGYGSSSAPSEISPGVSVTATVGGNGGGAGNGGPINIGMGAMVSTSGNFAFDPSGSAPTSIVTLGDYASGIKAQSIGGGGGDGGTGGGSTQDFGTGSTTGLSYGVGSTGSPGGDGGAVTIYVNPGNGIQTWGSSAPGIIAQSIGGGGGTSQGGSFSFAQSRGVAEGVTVKPGVNLLMGNTSATGGDGGTVLISVQAPIATHGNDSTGVLAQSIGGGGGLGGTAGSDGSGDNPVLSAMYGREFESDITNAIASGSIPQINPTFNKNIGGTGGTGGDGGAVTVYLASTISTLGNPVVVGGNQQASTGDWAHGIVAQSIGGGGGKGGTAMATGSGSDPAEINLTSNVAVGGAGGSGGEGGTVTINLQDAGVVQTIGYGASAVVAQSIGGGGGVGNDGSDAAGGTMLLGGKPVGASTVGSGGSVILDTVANNGSALYTKGTFADGMDLQAIGGGGGIAGSGSSLWDAQGFPKVASPMSFTLGLSGLVAEGGYGDSGGTVTVNPSYSNNYPLTVNVSGYGAYGIVAQSVGGGGGIMVANQAGSGTPAIALGGASILNDSGYGGPVVVNLTTPSVITASGTAGIGVVAQSVGGGGGILRLNDGSYATPTMTTGANSAIANGTVQGSAGGPVQVTSYATINANGEGGIGIFAQSVAGGGGLLLNGSTLYAGSPLQREPEKCIGICIGGSASGSDNFFVHLPGGSISATGTNGIGVFAQAAGNGLYADGTIDVVVGNGSTSSPVTVTGGSGTGAAAIWIDRPGNANGRFDSSSVEVQEGGFVTTQVQSAGTAIKVTGGGVVDVTNLGSITGNVILNGGYDNNIYGSSFDPNALDANGGLNDPRGSLFNGATGMWVPGAQARGNVLNQGAIVFDNAAMTTNLNGHYIQTSGGRFSPLIDSLNGRASLLQIDGTALVDGLIAPNAVSLLPGTVPVLTAGTLGTSPVKGLDSLLFRWKAETAGNTISLTPSATFIPADASLTASQASLANYNNRAWNASDPALANLFAGLSRIKDNRSYRSALDSLSAKATHAQSMAMLNSASSILGSSMSCPVFTGQSIAMTEDNCVWGQVNGRWTDQSTSGNTQGYHVSGTIYRFGAQHQVKPGWYLGGSLAAGNTHSDMKGGSSGNGRTYDGSVTLKHVNGPWQLAGSVAVSHGSFEVDRNVDFDGMNQKFESKPDALLAGVKLRAAYEVAHDQWYLKPYNDLDIYYSKLSGFTENANTPYALRVRGDDKVSVAITPMLEFGRRVDLDAKTSLRAYAALGVSYRPDSSYTIKSNFVTAGAAAGTFSDHLKSPEVLGKIDVGLQLYRAGGFEAKAGYTADIGSRYNSQSATARFAYHF